MNNKGFLDLGLVIVLVWGGILGTIAVNELTKDEKALELCKKQGSIQIGDSLYQCKKTATLGETKVIKVPVKVPCPKCKPVKQPCHDDRKIFPICEQQQLK